MPKTEQPKSTRGTKNSSSRGAKDSRGSSGTSSTHRKQTHKQKSSSSSQSNQGRDRIPSGGDRENSKPKATKTKPSREHPEHQAQKPGGARDPARVQASRLAVRRPAEVTQRATLIAQGLISKEALRFAEASSKHQEEQRSRKEKRKALLAELAAREKALKTLKARQEGKAEKSPTPQHGDLKAAAPSPAPTIPVNPTLTCSENTIVVGSGGGNADTTTSRPTSPCLYTLLEEIWETPYAIEKQEYELWDSLGLLDETPTQTTTPITLSVVVSTPRKDDGDDLLEIHPSEEDMIKEDGGCEPKDTKEEERKIEVKIPPQATSANDSQITNSTIGCRCSCQAKITSEESKETEMKVKDTPKPPLSPPPENNLGRLPIKARLGPKIKEVEQRNEGHNQGPQEGAPGPTRRQLRNLARIQLLRDRAKDNRKKHQPWGPPPNQPHIQPQWVPPPNQPPIQPPWGLQPNQPPIQPQWGPPLDQPPWQRQPNQPPIQPQWGLPLDQPPWQLQPNQPPMQPQWGPLPNQFHSQQPVHIPALMDLAIPPPTPPGSVFSNQFPGYGYYHPY